MSVHRSAVLSPTPTLTEFEGEKAHISIALAGEGMKVSGGVLDVLVKDESGAVLTDSRAERIARDQAYMTMLASKANNSEVLRKALASYEAAVCDPDNEFIHLYEIADAIGKHFGGQHKAEKTLGIDHQEWSWFGDLTNNQPLRQSRHRGKHPEARRSATSDELNEARRVAKLLIDRFGDSLPSA